MTDAMPDLLVFPKFFYPHLDAGQLAEQMLACGFDGVDVMIRKAAWCTQENFFETLPAFVKAMRDRGLKAYTVTTDWKHEKLDTIEDAYKLFADNGITMYRFLMQNYGGPGTYREDLARCRESMGRLEKLGRQYGVMALLQTHGGTLTWSPEAAYALVAGLDPNAVAVHYDPGNMWHQEGWTEPAKSLDILREYLAYIVVKNCGWFLAPDAGRDQKLTWRREWTRLDAGLVDWAAIVKLLKAANFDGPICMHNFYTNSLEGLIEGTTADVKYIRGLWANGQ